MARAMLLAVSLAVLTLAFSPWQSLASHELQLITAGAPVPSSAGGARVISGRARQTEPPPPVAQRAPHSDSYCLTCHSDPFLQTRFDDGRTLALYVDARKLRDSAHGLVTCLTCHDDRGDCPPERHEPLDQDAYQAEATEMCIRCHLAAAGGYAASAHGRPVLSGSGEGATCTDCHSPERSGHAVTDASDPQAQLASQSVHENCGRCHEEELDSFRETSHYKVALFGDPERPATCTTCHGDHSVRAVADPEKPVTTASLATVCGSCHHGADEAFASGWTGHATSPSRSAGFYYADRFIIISLLASVAFGLLHMTLDALRALADRGPRGGNSE